MFKEPVKNNVSKTPEVGEPTNESLVEIFKKIGSKDSSRTVST